MNLARTLCGILLAHIFAFGLAQPALAAPTDYAFKVVEPETYQGAGTLITIALTDLRTNAPVSDAVIFATRLDMAPEGMEGMTTPLEALPSGIPGRYQFRADLAMAGNWRFQIAAKVQGEVETVQAALILGVKP